MIINKSEQQFLLELARRAIEYYEQCGKLLEVEPKTIPAFLKEKRGCFVTLTINGQLRGCIGYLEGQNELWQDVIKNAVSAGFNDPRFPPLSYTEIPSIKIEVSILSQPQLGKKMNKDQLPAYLKENRLGVIVKQGVNQATYLPLVWEDLPDPIEFLASLCHKAGLPGSAWKENETKIYTYKAERFKEDDAL